MTEAVLDASVVIKWFRSEGERHVDSARACSRSSTSPAVAGGGARRHFAEAAGTQLITDDDLIVELAGAVAPPLAETRS